MNWKDHLNNLTTDSVVSAAKALDYLDGDQIRHLEDMLNDKHLGIKEWRARGITPVVDNITAKVITRSALTYQQEPQRTIYNGETENEAASDKYNELLGLNGLVAINASDIVSRLLKTCLILVQYVQETKKLSFSVLHRGNCDVDYDLITQEVKSILYTAGGVSPSGGQMYHYWDAEKIVDIEKDGTAMKVLSTEDNPYQMIPVVVRQDISSPRVGFWHKNAWEELIRLNEIVNLFHTEVRHGSRMQNFSPLFTNAKIAQGTVISPDAVVMLEESLDNDIYLEYKTPTINLAEFKSWLADLQEEIADNWGVNLKFGGSGSADSGFKLVVEETWNLETRKQRQKGARVAEEHLYNIVKSISDTYSLGLGDGELNIDFAEPSLAVDTATERDQDRQDVAAGITSREQVWRKNDPDLTETDIEERKQEIDGMSLPDFTDATS